MKTYTHEEMLDMVIGTKGSPERDQYEVSVQAFLVGLQVRKAREAKKLTQTQLGEMIGVKRSQVSRMENGHNLSLTTVGRAFKAMDMDATLNISGVGQMALC